MRGGPRELFRPRLIWKTGPKKHGICALDIWHQLRGGNRIDSPGGRFGKGLLYLSSSLGQQDRGARPNSSSDLKLNWPRILQDIADLIFGRILPSGLSH
jgi:hypothetical protein